ncbi:hypothetical protein [Microbacterium deminutum]|uniref:Uncharacterized protein n=1 Tax=Microbacterium deminutum TaxID=344164 RepID=A0ABP5C6D8_9MICO
MDAATRAELSALRRRAYGPGADIHEDPPALARLVELEDLALAEDSRAVPAPPAADPEPPSIARPEPPNTAAPSPRHRSTALRGSVIAAVTAGVAIVITIALTTPRAEPSADATPTVTAAAGYAYGGDPDATTLRTFSLSGSSASHTDWPVDGGGRPAFPQTTTIRWATDIGTYYGWHVWVAQGYEGAQDQFCILIERAADVRTRCVKAADRVQGTLSVSLTAADIDPNERPGEMSASESIGFWWLEQNRVEAVLGRFESG